MVEQVRAWSGLPLLGLGCAVAYRTWAGGAVVSGLMPGTTVAGLGAPGIPHEQHPAIFLAAITGALLVEAVDQRAGGMGFKGAASFNGAP